MFGMGGSEILVILVIALLFLGPDKLPEAAKKISKGIRDIKRQSRVLQQTIEDDEHIGGAIRDLRSALRGEEPPPRPKAIKAKVIEASAEEKPDAPKLEAAADAPKLEAAVDKAETEAAKTEPAADATEAHKAEATADATAAHKVEAAAETTAAPDAPETTETTDAPQISLPPTAGERAHAPSADEAAELAQLVKPAPNTIPRGAAAAAAAEPAKTEHTEPEHG